MNFPIPNPPQVRLYRMQDFLGVDFSSSPASVDDRRSPDAYNFMHVNGQNVKRNGYNLVHAFLDGSDDPLGEINGLYEFGSVLLVHVGTYLYTWNGTTAAKIADNTMADERSFFINLNGEVVIFDGTTAWLVTESAGVYTAATLSSVAHVPTTSINRKYDGTNAVPYEVVNLITSQRINKFKGSASYRTYQLDVYPIDAAAVTAYTLNVDGTWTTWLEGTTTGTISVNRTTGVVTFYSTPGATPIAGEDNVKIQFSKTTGDYVSRINKCTFAAVFGSSGNGNRIFASGNPDYPNTDWYCDLYDPTYWPDTYYSQVGVTSSAITGYSRVGNAQLAIHKEIANGDQGVYYRTGAYSMDFADDIFTIRAGYTDVEMLTMRTAAMLEGEPLFLSSLGVHAMIPRDTLTSTEYVLPNRSFYVNNKLIDEANLDDACAVTVDDKYYLAINDHMYVADGNYKYYNYKSGKREAQYEWYYWTDIPAVSMCEFGGVLYFGDDAGCVYRFVEDQYWDYDTAYDDNQRPVELYWTCPLKSLNTVSQRKTIRHTVAIAQPYSTSKCIIGYLLDGEKHVMKEDEISTFDFGNIDFGDLTFLGGSAARAIVSRKSLRKFNFVQLYFEAPDATPAGLYAIEIQYTLAGKVRR